MSAFDRYILLAEDDLVVAELIEHALLEHDPTLRIVHVRDGVDALDFLYARGAHEHRNPIDPAVVLLDLKMPRLDGLEVLRLVKSDERLKATPIVMLTSSQDERDVRESYQLGANAFVVKSVDFRRFVDVLQQIAVFWMKINQPPHIASAVTADASRHAG